MKRVDGFWYPDSEERLHRNHSSLWTPEKHILPHISNKGTVIQAGGAVGAWPITYAQHFDVVHSFEPNPVLWECFRRNVDEYEADIYMYHMGLSNRIGTCSMVDVQSNNMGAWHITPDESSQTPMAPLDSLGFSECDLLQLDVEGGEIDALEGAEKTIFRCRPIIVVEVKPATLRAFNRTTEQLYRVLRKLRYKLTDKFARDELWTPY